jgi:hypothetical protein
MNLISTEKHSLRTWLVDSSGNIAVSRAGVAFLDGQITDLESRSLAARSRIDVMCGQTVNTEGAQRALKTDQRLNSGRSIPFIWEKDS